MTSREFNEKYAKYIEPGFNGLSIDIPEVTEFLDKHFEEFIKIPGFQFSQIKAKFGMARFYSNLLDAEIRGIEKGIDKIFEDAKESKNIV